MPARPRKASVGRKPKYPSDLQPGLILCWSVLRAPDSKLLAASMDYLAPMLRIDSAWTSPTCTPHC
ncbi:hypothetical protein ACIPUB_17365 [Paeniglutamicibacter sp. ORCA_105]|uniref:hypothetical protein n=1 Tax=Paeniglutamicibacter sp. ORCA_105 TaxID=3377336 RepID=UPI00389466C7